MKQIVDIPRTAMEVFNMLPEGTRCEVIDNTLYMSPSPTPNHQKVLLKLAIALSTFVENNNLGEVFILPCDVYLSDEASVVQPDILFLKEENKGLVTKKGIIGSPDLVIEILSSNKDYDQLQKFELYQSNGIAEYLMVNPDNKQVWHYVLQNGKYAQRSTSDGTLHFETLGTIINF